MGMRSMCYVPNSVYLLVPIMYRTTSCGKCTVGLYIKHVCVSLFSIDFFFNKKNLNSSFKVIFGIIYFLIASFNFRVPWIISSTELLVRVYMGHLVCLLHHIRHLTRRTIVQFSPITNKQYCLLLLVRKRCFYLLLVNSF